MKYRYFSILFLILLLNVGVNANSSGSFSLGYGSLNPILSPQSIVHMTIEPTVPVTTQVENKLVGRLLNFPNPFSISTGATVIGYELNQDMDTTLYIYNMEGYSVFKKINRKSDNGGKKGYNTITFSASTVGYTLPAGIYFVILLDNQDETLGKLKLAIIP